MPLALFVAVCVAVLSTGCTRPHGPTGPAATTGAPAGDTAGGNGSPVALWRLTDGFVPAGENEARGPVLAVYGDGTAIADARFRGRLTASELADLVARLAADLTNPAVGSPTPPGSVTVQDAPTTVFTVRSGGQELTASANALDEARGHGGYPAALYDARDRLDAVRQRVVHGGQKYTADRVRLVVVPETGGGAGTTGTVAPWPAEVPLPVGESSGAPMTAVLTGTAAATAAGALPDGWHQYRTASGEPVRAVWRYLLPDE